MGARISRFVDDLESDDVIQRRFLAPPDCWLDPPVGCVSGESGEQTKLGYGGGVLLDFHHHSYSIQGIKTVENSFGK